MYSYILTRYMREEIFYSRQIHGSYFKLYIRMYSTPYSTTKRTNIPHPRFVLYVLLLPMCVYLEEKMPSANDIVACMCRAVPYRARVR